MELVVLILIVGFILIDILLIIATASIASSKGRSPLLWGLLAVFMPLIALLVIALLPSRATPGSIQPVENTEVQP
jgi:hypothetical protein